MKPSEYAADHSTHHWTMRFAVSLSAIIALFGTWGWLTHYGLLPRAFAVVAGGALMAGVCLVAQGVCNNMAVEARRARARGLTWSFRVGGAVALGFGAISALGMHHGWQIAKAVAPSLGVAPPPDWLTTMLFIFVAFGEPVSFWVVDAIRSHEAAQRHPAAAEPRGAGRSWSPKVAGGADATPPPSARRVAATVGMVGAAALALGAAQPATAEMARPVVMRPAESVSSERDSPIARAQAFAAAKWSERRIAVELGVTRHNVRRLLGRVS